MENKRILVITAHADDAEFFAGATLAKFVSLGYEIEEIITTDNGRGSFELGEAELVNQSRATEAEQAAKIFGKTKVHFLGYPDGFLGDTPLNVLREQYMLHIRRFCPQILFTFDPWAPYETHPDHRHVGMAAVEACGFAHLPLYHPEHIKEGFKPHMTIEQYLFAKDSERCNHIVDVTGFLEKKIEALCAHESQMKMTIDDFRMALEATGTYQGLLPILDRDNFRQAMSIIIPEWAKSIGAKGGFESGEEFRYTRVDDIFKMTEE